MRRRLINTMIDQTRSRSPQLCLWLGTALLMSGCSDITPPLPGGTPDPRAVQTAEGADQMYVAARAQFQNTFAAFIVSSGLLSDELQSIDRGGFFDGGSIQGYSGDQYMVLLDTRRDVLENNPLYLSHPYSGLQRIRKLTGQARGALWAYDRDRSAGRRAALFAMEGYAEIWLADLFCSGVPLSTFDFDGDYTYKPGSTTKDIYRHAITLFDSARLAAPDSMQIVHLANIGTARAYMAIGEYDSASRLVADIPVDYRFSERIKSVPANRGVTDDPNNIRFRLTFVASVADREGGNGFPYISQKDPRTAVLSLGTTQFGFQRSAPSLHPPDAVSDFIVASGIEAELIKAEVALKKNDVATWYEVLKTLRTTGTYTHVDTTFRYDTIKNGSSIERVDTVVTRADTAWVAGTGGVSGVRPLAPDPGATPADARIRMTFNERASWLFLTGQRQGDLRRLVRQYGLGKVTVYPTGAYPGYGTYGDRIDLIIPSAELNNPLFKGCQGRD